MVRDPVAMMAGGKRLRESQIQELYERFGLLDPLHIRYLKYIKNILTFNFGYSYRTGQAISLEIYSRLENTLILCLTAEFIAVLIGIFLGVIAASRRGGIIDTSLSSLSAITQGLPCLLYTSDAADE